VINPFVLLVSFAIIQVLKARKAKNLPTRKLNLPTFSEPSKDSSLPVRLIGGFLFFWYDFIIGDDWRVAAGVILGFFATHAIGISGWWVMPVVVALMLGYTLHEATRPAKVSA
jgi:hypothetical protein